MSGAELAAVMEAELRRVGDDDRAKHEERHLRSELQHLGASVPAIREVAMAALASHGLLATTNSSISSRHCGPSGARVPEGGRRAAQGSVSRRSSRVT